MVEVRWTPQSLEDIENIAEYISNDSMKFAIIQVQDFFEAAEILENFPKAGRVVPELSNRDVRELIVGFYRLIYRVKNDQLIEILTIYHSHRLLKTRTLKKRT